MGYYRAGFDVVGVDIKPQPRYPFEFHQGDAMTWPLDGFDVVHASPPCQAYCALKTMHNARIHPKLIEPLRSRLQLQSHCWVIENVKGAPLFSPIMLCGSMFDLGAHGFQLRRHRYFESNVKLATTGLICSHAKKTLGVYGAKVRNIAQEKRHYALPKETRGKPVGVVLPQSWGFEAMDCGWMNIKEASEAIPPAYTEYIGKQLIQHLRQAAG